MPQNFRVVQNLSFGIQQKFSVYDVHHHTDLWSVNSNQIRGIHSILPNFPFDCRWLDLDKAAIEIFGLSHFSPVFSKLTCCEGGSRCSPISVADDMEVYCCVGKNEKVQRVMWPILYYSIVILHDMSAVIGDCRGLLSLSASGKLENTFLYFFVLFERKVQQVEESNPNLGLLSYFFILFEQKVQKSTKKYFPVFLMRVLYMSMTYRCHLVFSPTSLDWNHQQSVTIDMGH